MKLVNLFATVVAAMALGSSAYAAEVKFGLVDKQVLGQDSLYAKNVNEKMKKEFGSRQDGLIAREKDLRGKFEQLERDKDVISESERVKKEREIASLQQSLQEDGSSLQEDFMHRQEKETAAFNKVLNEVLSEIAKEEKLDIILDQQLALFNDRKADYTYKALQKLDSKYKDTKKQ